MHSLEPTGERTVPGVAHEAYWFARHLVAYEWVATHLAERLAAATVVDAGAGEGYGAALLAETGPHLTIALELDEAAAGHAAREYPRTVVARANLAALPLSNARCDVVVTLQVIEHLWSLREFLADCRRVLRPGGSLVVATPNRPVFSPGLSRGERPTNPFHVEEFDSGQVHELLDRAGFTSIRLHGVEHGPRLSAWEAIHGPIVQAQVDAVLADAWDPALADLVSSVTSADFTVVDEVTATSHDLLAVAEA